MIPEKFFIENASMILKSMADETRLEILLVLLKKEMQAGEIANELSMSPSAISHQLRILKSVHLVVGKRNGRNIFYSLTDDHVKYIIQILKDHISEIYNA
jgi:ArsR family transcriptional regulator